ncbi:hypothetical protein ES332_A08G194200v1 [Gossypium tomentosum]|uniref:Uncharacterized protein n=1 Tax=Gossypium tomentosum TaxID=34277 RepID=A0A5D2PHS5_GOSTO|nr:hypothetical protein ES332_A08G194200v1 [Gossypium tomentosum]
MHSYLVPEVLLTLLILLLSFIFMGSGGFFFLHWQTEGHTSVLQMQ